MALAIRCGCGVMLAALAGAAMAAEAGPATRLSVTPVLEPDPAVMKIIDGLGDGESALLPKLRTAGDINDVARRWGLDKRGPGHRDYCIKMAWMPDRRRAVFCGANHGVPHRLNDVWEYDLPSNTWVCLYAPDKSKNARRENWNDVVVDKNGVFRTKRGGPASVGHEYWRMTYDPEQRMLMWFCHWGIDPAFSKEMAKKMGAKAFRPPTWLFYPYERRWQPVTASTFSGGKPIAQNVGSLEYVPDLGGIVWIANNWQGRGMWVYNAKADTWRNLKPNGGNVKAFQANAVTSIMTYLPDRKLIVAQGRRGKLHEPDQPGVTAQYDVAKNAWRKVAEGSDVPPGHVAFTNIAYDRVGRVVLLWDSRWSKAVWAYDPDAVTWTKLKPTGPPPPTKGGDHRLAYYDPARNVFVIPGRWVYRHKAREK